jgi:hypothetical protein
VEQQEWVKACVPALATPGKGVQPVYFPLH